MTADAGQAVIAAINAASQIEHGVPARRSRADACARLITGSDEVRARPEVIVHLHADSAAYDDGTAVAPEPHMPAVRDRVGDRPSRKPGERRASLRVTGEHGAELAVGSGRGHERTITHHRLVHTLDLRLTLHADRTLEARFPAGNPVDRTIEHAPFTAPAPADPNLITGNWTGERLNHNWLHLAVQSRQQTAPKLQQNAAA